MDSIFDLVLSQLGSSQMGEIQRQLGVDRSTAEKAVPAAMGALFGALARNSSQSSGAEALFGALTRDHDGSILEDLMGQIVKPQESIGNGILKHVLGGKRNAVEGHLGQSLGLQPQQIGKLLTMLAPIVLGALGRTQRQKQLDPGGLRDLLGRERAGIGQRVPAGSGMGGLGSLLDRDGDGEVADDIAATVGKSLLKNLFKRR